MPDILLPTLIFQMIIVGYSPGPANIYALSSSIRSTRKEAFIAWLGMLTGFTIATFALAVLTHYIGEVLGSYVIYLKYIGGGYMVYLAYVMWKNRINLSNVKTVSFINGLFVQLTNAKMMLFALTVFSTYVLPYSLSFIDLFKASCLLYIAGPLGNLLWLVMGQFLKKMFDRYRKIVDAVCAILLLGCAAYIVFY